MPGGTRGSQWSSLRRSLILLQRLLQGPASSNELIAHVLRAEGKGVYPESDSARKRALKRDRHNLKHHLDVKIHYDPAAGLFVLESAGPYFSLELSEKSLRALALISATFGGESGEQAEIQALVDELINRMPPETRRKLDYAALPIDFSIFQNVDPNGIPEKVWRRVYTATRERRKLAFNYLSPSYADRQPRYFVVAPQRIVYQWGHWYLRAYGLLRGEPSGAEEREALYRRFRMGNILDDERLAALPSKLPDLPRKPPRLAVHYRLLPPLSRGAISRHFDEMTVTRLDDGSVEVRGYTDDDWEAARILLGYGEFCVALGGEEVRRRVRGAVEGMAQNYGLEDGI